MEEHQPMSAPLEMWGGIEGTVNRVHDRYFDQMERNGHARRAADLDLFAGLGLRAIRYPVLWERVAPDGPERADWTWPDERLSRLQTLGVRPIVGLIHHGSGPRDTNLLDPAFPERLAAYAGAVARRYPWVEEYTPVNEPLTTARFSALYGHWYPHATDDLSFSRALLNQCRAVVLSMEAIRRVNPAARLIQTDDLGKTYSTPALSYQADLENERRWVTFDILCGRLAPGTPMWEWFRHVGIEAAELEWFLDNPCPPDVIGINHYLSSERFLDERLDLYPTEPPGTNGIDRYVDVLAARVLSHGAAGPQTLMQETWDRFHLPIAVTEAHNSGMREEQIRWLDDVWQDAQRARQSGADVRAVTVWSLLGTYDWHCLVTRDEGFYEPGVFDIQETPPRPTAIARMVRDLAKRGRHDHPVLVSSGWWHRPERFTYGPVVSDAYPPPARRGEDTRKATPAPILVLAGDGPLPTAFTAACQERHLACQVLDRRQARLSSPAIAEIVLWENDPWAVVDLEPIASTHGAEKRDARDVLVGLCARRRLPLVTFSRDDASGVGGTTPDGPKSRILPRDGRREGDDSSPEWGILAEHPLALVIRTDLPCPHEAVLGRKTGSRSTPLAFPIEDAGVDGSAPRALVDVIHAALDLLVDGESGIWAASGRTADASGLRLSRVAEDRNAGSMLQNKALPPMPLFAETEQDTLVAYGRPANRVGSGSARQQPLPRPRPDLPTTDGWPADERVDASAAP